MTSLWDIFQVLLHWILSSLFGFELSEERGWGFLACFHLFCNLWPLTLYLYGDSFPIGRDEGIKRTEVSQVGIPLL